MPGRPRSVLLRLEVRPAGRRCTCAHNTAHVMLKGDLRFVVRDRGPAAGEKGYCAACASEMLVKAKAELDALEAALQPFH
ncbi:hypothetical protein NHL50_09835 [Acidimicrobiia bacterium EGI L10123]|uniref:hypothetical protein n=1 Tax=Salinilacustrithrix flava TaxID=2957203 RepID=UPI003D7C3278|nr:hypothetical protein [Acidimicrobiia bacterium EGI L10123]